MIKKIINLILVFTFLFIAVVPVLAQENINLYFFWGEGCPHCASEKKFLDKIEKKYPEVVIKDYEIWNNDESRQLMIDVGKKLGISISGVPFTLVGEKYYSGWLSEATTGKNIENTIVLAIKDGHRDMVEEIIENQEQSAEDSMPVSAKSPLSTKMLLPLLGEIDTKTVSLPLIAVVLGGLDGFNPCAMWTLLFLISLLLGMHDKRRRWILGSIFIFTSAFVYFLFMAAWLNLLLFVGFILWVRILISFVAIGGGAYNLREFFVNKNSGCKVTGDEKRQVVFEKIKGITQQKSFWLAMVGIILLAFAVNLVELICSAGLPVIFTQILTMSNLPQWQYLLYIALYIFVFLLDDLFVFFVAMITMEMTGISTKYARASHLIGGILMLIVGLLLIFKPELLMFG